MTAIPYESLTIVLNRLEVLCERAAVLTTKGEHGHPEGEAVNATLRAELGAGLERLEAHAVGLESALKETQRTIADLALAVADPLCNLADFPVAVWRDLQQERATHLAW